MKKIYLSILALCSLQAYSQPFYSESFEGTSGYSFPNGNGVGTSPQDFFDRTDSAGAPPQEAFIYNGYDGSFFIAAEDIDGVLNSTIGVVYLDNIDISGRANLRLTAAFASGTDIDIDGDADSISVQVKIDSGNWVTIGKFEADSATFTSSSGPFNGQFAEDTNGDGFGNGIRLDGSFTDFSWTIPGVGDSLDVRILVDLNSGDEEAAFDNIRISGSLSTTIEEKSQQVEAIKLYPNPAQDYVFISSPTNELVQIDIIDLKGRQIQSTNANGFNMKINTNNLEKGIYILRAHTANRIETLKLQLQ